MQLNLEREQDGFEDAIEHAIEGSMEVLVHDAALMPSVHASRRDSLVHSFGVFSFSHVRFLGTSPGSTGLAGWWRRKWLHTIIFPGVGQSFEFPTAMQVRFAEDGQF